jgi:NADH dehydrogenase [ubiquinone] 1 alpha subcomplex assembly factor 7
MGQETDMNALATKIVRWIESQGPISVAQYMNLCQFDAEGGSYTAHQTIGRDFITSPEISQTFGEMLGLWVAQTWHDQGRPKSPRLIEMGPGRGTLMADALRAIAAAAPEFLDSAEIVLVEASPALMKVQREKLKTIGADIAWHEHFDDALIDRPLYLLANEFFDCLPVHQYVKTERGWCERMVGLTNGGLSFALSPDPVPATVIPPSHSSAANGAVYETAPAALALTEEVARVVQSRGGGALIMDYGYDIPGFGETLQAVTDGNFVDVLNEPGDSDLSAHVDFLALARAAATTGAAVYGPTTQCKFLADLGIGERGERLIKSNPHDARTIAAAIDRLVNPALMGTLFKVLTIVPKNAPQPPGYGYD